LGNKILIKNFGDGRTQQLEEIGNFSLDTLDEKVTELREATTVVYQDYIEVDRRMRAALSLLSMYEEDSKQRIKYDQIYTSYETVVRDRFVPVLERDLLDADYASRNLSSLEEYKQLITFIFGIKNATILLPFEDQETSTYFVKWEDIYSRTETKKLELT